MIQKPDFFFRTGLAAVLLAVMGGRVEAEDWAAKMFDKLEHEFGTVARGTPAEYRFQIKNLYKEEMKISSVRASCGCTTPTITQRTLTAGETAELVARYNTDRFLGKRGATIIVQFAPPFAAEVRLRVNGYIRRDVVFSPSRIELGSINAGEGAEKTVKITYAGRDTWEISDVRTSNEYFQVEARPTGRGNGRVEYELEFALSKNAPTGYINEPIILVTNDRNLNTVTLPVEGRVTASVSVSPPTLQLGVLRPGEAVTRQIVVRGQTPFRISRVFCEGGDEFFRIDGDDSERKVHLLAVTFTASEKTGTFAEEILIEADGIGVVIPPILARVEVRAE